MRRGNISTKQPEVWIFNGDVVIKGVEEESWFSRLGIFKKKMIYGIDEISHYQLEKLRKMGIKVEIKTELKNIKIGDMIDQVNCFYDIIEELKLRWEVKRYIDNNLDRLKIVDDLRLTHIGLMQFTDWTDFWKNI